MNFFKKIILSTLLLLTINTNQSQCISYRTKFLLIAGGAACIVATLVSRYLYSWPFSRFFRPKTINLPIETEHIKANTVKAIGVKNPGNRCYLISLLQCLSQINFPVDSLEYPADKYSMEEAQKIKTSFSDFIENLRHPQQEDALEIPEILLRAASNCYPDEEVFTRSGDQQDPKDYLLFLLNTLEEEKKHMFNLKIENKIEYTTTEEDTISYTESKTDNTMLFLPITPTENSITLQNLLNSYFSKEEREHETPEDLPSTKSSSPINEPEVLILQLNLFAPDKVKTKVEIDNNIKLEPSIESNSSYEFNSMILRNGDTPGNGHYISIIKRQKKYYFCNNNRLTEYCSLEEALSAAQKDAFSPYIIFYNRQ